MWMKSLLFGISSSILLLFLVSSCDKTPTIVDGNDVINYIYVNRLDIPVKIEYHWADANASDATDKTKTVAIAKGQSLDENINLNDPHDIIILECVSVRLIFDDTKELWYYSDKEKDKIGCIFNMQNYTYKKDSDVEETYTYTISQEIYDLATDIKN